MWPLKNYNYKYMKVLTYIFLVLAVSLLIFNLFHIDFEEPLEGESFAAVIGVGASLWAIILLSILKIALKIKEKMKG